MKRFPVILSSMELVYYPFWYIWTK